MSLKSRLTKAFNAFSNRDPTREYSFSRAYRQEYGMASYSRPDRVRFTVTNERSIIAAVYNRIATDGASITIEHVRTNQNGRYESVIKDELNNALTLEANKDQTGRALIQDIIMSLLDEGSVAVVPVDTDIDPYNSESYKIYTLRTGKILEWYPDYVKVEIYDDRDGKKKQILVPKDKTAIIENPFYAVMNEPNSTLVRLKKKLNMLDAVDEQTSSGKLDIIIQLPYNVKGDIKRAQAEQRKKDVELQLANSKYGIAYIGETEHITQLNRPAENNFMAQIEYLTNMLFSQLGVTQSILDGTADEATLNNYFNRTIEPIMAAIVDEFRRKFLTQTARTQGQSIMYFRDPFRLMPASQIPEMADKLTRNEILSSNEVRAMIGYKPSDDPAADELRNANINKSNEEIAPTTEEKFLKEENQNGI